MSRSLRWRATKRVVRTLDGALGYGGQWIKQVESLGHLTNPFRPSSLNEKLLRRKLDPYPPEWVLLADKLRVRDYVARMIGGQYLNDLLLATADPNEIRLHELPRCFVVKPNHGSGWVRLVRDSGAESEAAIRAECLSWLGMRYGVIEHERWYDEIPPRIMVERLLEGDGSIPPDIRFFVFHGRAEIIQVNTGRFTDDRRRGFYDRDWRRLPVVWRGRRTDTEVSRPTPLKEMLELAERLAGDQDFVRVDLYCPDDQRIVFGELTLVPGGGFIPFVPREWDRRLGALW